MSVLIDSCVWSFALRRRPGSLNPAEEGALRAWRELVRTDRAKIIGAIRQEILTGIRDAAAFERLRERVALFADEPVTAEDYVEAATFSNRCRAAGVATSPVDMLICAVAWRCSLEILTTDDDFLRYAEHLPIALHGPREPQA